MGEPPSSDRSSRREIPVGGSRTRSDRWRGLASWNSTPPERIRSDSWLGSSGWENVLALGESVTASPDLSRVGAAPGTLRQLPLRGRVQHALQALLVFRLRGGVIQNQAGPSAQPFEQRKN